jgi:phytoene dehydrogenase-like protein
VLKKLGLEREVTFERYDPQGFDHMRSPEYAMDIPSEPEELIQRLSSLFPESSDRLRQFINEVEKTGEGLKKLSPPINPIELIKHPLEVFSTVQHLNSTLQSVLPTRRDNCWRSHYSYPKVSHAAIYHRSF